MKHENLKHVFRGAGVLGMLLASGALWAASWVDRTRLDGFFSARYSITDEKAYWLGDLEEDGINMDGSFYGTKLGLNITSRLNDRVSVTTQLFAPIQENNYEMHVDWAFATFALNEQWSLRAGKIKYPVGIVNEYVEVGVTYPWIQAPLVIYSENMEGPQATRESYTGASLLWNRYSGSWSWGLDLFGGEVDLESMNVKKMIGVTGRANWDELVIFQLSYYHGDMKIDLNSLSGMMLNMMRPMNNRRHSAVVGGVKVDWNNLIAYAEAASVTMDFENMSGVAAGDSDSWYATLGYRLGKWLPHLTYQDWSRDNGNGHQIATLGLNYSVSSKVVLKGELSQVDTDQSGLFITDTDGDGVPDVTIGGSTNMFSLALDMVF